MENHIPSEIDESIITHCDTPLIKTIDDFLDNETCAHFINIAKDKLEQALVSTNNAGIVSGGRTGKNCWIKHDYDKITFSVAKRIADLVGLPLQNAEKYQFIYYDTNQEYRSHMDSWDHDNSEKSKRCMRHGGQRMFTALGYLNNVRKGGHTRFTRKNISVAPKKGRLLIFQNVLPGTNKRDPLSEHAGSSVINGEKWGFNLWFREDNFQKEVIYSLKTFDTSEKIEVEEIEIEEMEIEEMEIEETEETKEMKDITTNKEERTMDSYQILNGLATIYPKFISEDDVSNFQIELGQNFFSATTSEKEVIWLKNNKFPKLINRIEKITNEAAEFYESICFVKYPPKFVHNRHFDAFNEKSTKSKAFTEKRGQRLKTITGFLTNDISYTFKPSSDFHFDQASLLLYDNVHENSIHRIDELSKIIKNKSNKSVISFNIYIRQFSNLNKINPSCNLVIENTEDTESTESTKHTEGNKNTEGNQNMEGNKNTEGTESSENTNYSEILSEIYTQFENRTICKKGFKTIDFGSIKSNNWQNIIGSVLQLKSIRKETGILNNKYLTEEYAFDEYTPIIINDVFSTKAVNLISKFYMDCILNNQFELGDRQSRRFKTRNDPYSRIIHYELLPLIEKFTNKKLRPSYTYLSCYIKGSDLPCHGDNPNCEITVSYLLDKPKDSAWNIYFHKERQEKHCGGRSSFTPDKADCIACDCERGGLMAFKGQDHLHFREPLDYDYYNLLLLHYVSIDNTEADVQKIV